VENFGFFAARALTDVLAIEYATTSLGFDECDYTFINRSLVVEKNKAFSSWSKTTKTSRKSQQK
jgi:hypothetical protein